MSRHFNNTTPCFPTYIKPIYQPFPYHLTIFYHFHTYSNNTLLISPLPILYQLNYHQYLIILTPLQQNTTLLHQFPIYPYLPLPPTPQPIHHPFNPSLPNTTPPPLIPILRNFFQAQQIPLVHHFNFLLSLSATHHLHLASLSLKILTCTEHVIFTASNKDQIELIYLFRK